MSKQERKQKPRLSPNLLSSLESMHSYDYFAVLDFEATCDEPRGPSPQEIIEWPTVFVNRRTLQVDFEFHQYVRPVYHPKLTPFCTELTGITQSIVDAGKPFAETVCEFTSFLVKHQFLLPPIAPIAAVGQKKESDSKEESKSQNAEDCDPNLADENEQSNVQLHGDYFMNPKRTFVFVTCGDWDLKTCFPVQYSATLNMKDKIDGQFRIAKDAHAFYKTWVNIKTVFESVHGEKGRGMSGMLQTAQLKLKGRHHSGIDDSRNIARLLVSLITKWRKVDSSLEKQYYSL